MENKKMMEAIAKAVGNEVEIKTVEKVDKNILATAVSNDDTFNVILSERKNQYGVYYRVMNVEKVKVAEDGPKEEIDMGEAIANINEAKKFSKESSTPVYVMSNGKRTVVIKTDANKVRHEKYGYWTAAIFEGGEKVSA